MGKVYVVGLGPGGREYLTIKAAQVLQECDAIIGYQGYLELIKELLEGKEVISSGMRRELERCAKAVALAREGKKVALVSGGDPGIYGMAGPILELNAREKDPVPVEVIPGVTAAGMAAALLGSPLMHDSVFISLSDLLTPWEVIQKRLYLAGEGDFVVALYNPRSQGRPHYLEEACSILLKYRKAETPVGLVRKAGREGEEILLSTLGQFPAQDVDMFSTVIIGNTRTYCADGKMITPRGYVL